jgi:hypothetical protein
MINKLVSSTNKTNSDFFTFKEGHLYILKTEEIQVLSPGALYVLVPCKRKNIYNVWSLCE